ncbi:U3 small nucleolar RNA-associated protein 22, partial [Phenoliferia sp. Uapishka_3]
MAAGVVGGDAWAGWRKTVEWLAGVEWTDGVWFRVEGDLAFDKDDFRKAFKGKPLFVDPTGTVNLAAGIDLSTLEMLRQDAKTTIALLLSEADEEDKFNGSLVAQTRESERFDNFIRISVPPSVLSAPLDGDDALDIANPLTALVSGLSSTLRRALGTRIKTFQLMAPPLPSIAVQGATSKPAAIVISIGILLESSEAGRLVDQGPSAEDEAACAEFRAFWGRKSELRRFKDGAIVESIVWDEQQPNGLGQQRNAIVGQIVKYIVEARHGIPEANIDAFAGSMDHLLVEPEAVRRAIFLQDPVMSGKSFASILEAYEALERELKDLPDLPLAVSSIQPSAPGLRYSSIFTPAPRRLKNFERFPESTKFIEVHDIVLTLEGSGRWPEDLEGVQKIKAAFLSKIAEGLARLHTVVKAEVVFDLESRPIDDNVALEILTASGFAFRARIFYDRSLLLLQQRETKLGGPTSSPTDSPLEVYQERFVHAPRHHAALATLQHHFTSYSPTVRLVKRWLSAHMLAAHVPTELVELLAASVFIDPASMYDPPNSGATGFARVMETLASWKWRDEPLLVALYSFSTATTAGRRPQFNKTKKEKALRAFESRRLAEPAVNEFAWVVCTEEDPEGKVWGRGTGKVAASRIRGLAKATLKTLNDGLVSGKLDVEQLFNAPLADYAFLIHLDPSAVPRHFQSTSPNPKALSSRHISGVLAGAVMGSSNEDGSPPRLGWDPVADFVTEVQSLYPSTFLLFHSPDGSPVIGGIWNPSAEAARAWKIGLGFLCKPAEEDASVEAGKARVVLDKAAVLREVERLGKGLVQRTELVQQ